MPRASYSPDPSLYSPSAAPSAFDFEHLDRQTMGDAALAGELLALYREQAPQLLREIEQAQDERSLREAAHRLSGASRAVGASDVAAVSMRLEQAVLAADLAADFPSRPALVIALAHSVALAEAALGERLS